MTMEAIFCGLIIILIIAFLAIHIRKPKNYNIRIHDLKDDAYTNWTHNA